MEIKIKRQFLSLFIDALRRNGYMIGTFDFKEELTKVYCNEKYSNLFYFFHSEDDFDFTKELCELDGKAIIEILKNDNGITLRLDKTWSYQDYVDLGIVNYDQTVFSLMDDLVREISLNKYIQGLLPNGAKGIFRKKNPNGSYEIDDFSQLITDGIVTSKVDPSYLVEEASFVGIKTFEDDELQSLKIFSMFDHYSDILTKVSSIADMDKQVNPHATVDYMDSFKAGIIPDNRYLTVNDNQDEPKCKVYRYTSFLQK